MFYSHEILTSREHGVATVWLVATLGSRTNLKKVGRKDILQVDISKACGAINRPAAPMALRLQSNLLYGVSRVFAEQCSYVLGDVQAATNNMRQMLRSVTVASLEVGLAKVARPGALLLADDPAFDPGQNIQDIDAEFLIPGLVSDVDSQGRISSPHTPLTDGGLPAILIPSSASDAGAMFGSFPSSDPAALKPGRLSDLLQRPLTDLIIQSDEALLPEADFTIDADGNLLEPGATTTVAEDESPLVQQYQIHADEEVLQGIGSDMLPVRQQDEALVMPSSAQRAENGSDILSSLALTSPSHSTDYADARLTQKRRKVKPLGLDRGALELRNSDIAAWSSDYLANMRESIEAKHKARDRTLGKKNATFWTWEAGIGGVGLTAYLRTCTGCPDPLDAFHGEKLYNSVLGIRSNETRKRGSQDSGDSLNGRRVRRRTESPELGRTANGLDDQEPDRLGYEEDIEYGRDAPTPLQGGQDFDLSSTMPWNMSSGAGSKSQSFARNQFRAGSRSSATPMPLGRGHIPQRPDSRTVSASPMLGLPGAGPSPGDYDQANNWLDPLTDSADFEVEGLAQAFDDPEGGEENQHVRHALEHESGNFIDFVEQAIATRAVASGSVESSIAFDVLLPPAENTRIVAAQALLHSLTLAAKGLVELKQRDHFERIWIIPVH